MNEEQIDAGAQQLVALIHAVPTDTDLFLRLNRLVLDLGRPVSVEELAAAAGWTVAEVQAELDREVWRGVDRDEHGRLAGFGLTLQPTVHAFTAGGKTVYGWCATDTLQFPADLGAAGSNQPARPPGSPSASNSPPPTSSVWTHRRRWCRRYAPPRSLGMRVPRSANSATSSAHASCPHGEVVPIADEFEIARRARQQLGWASPSKSQPSCGC